MQTRKTVFAELIWALVAVVVLNWLLPSILNAYFYHSLSSVLVSLSSGVLSLLIAISYMVLRTIKERRYCEVLGMDFVPQKETSMSVGEISLWSMTSGAALFITSQLFTNAFFAFANGHEGSVASYPSFIQVNDISIIAAWIFVYALLPAVSEEFLYRGVIWGGISRKNSIVAFILSCILFSLAHGSISQSVQALLNGLAWCTLYSLTGSLAAPCIAHFIYNLLGVLVTSVILPPYSIIDLTYQFSSAEEYTTAGIGLLGLGMLSAAALVCVYYMLARRSQTIGAKKEKIIQRLNVTEYFLIIVLVCLQAGLFISILMQGAI